MGKINSLVIVIDNPEWMGKPGDILRDIIGTPVLGLPQDVRVDKGIPFNEVAQGSS